MKRHLMLISIILHALVLLLAYILQGMVFPYLRVIGLVPVLLPLVSTGAAVFEGRAAGGVVGLFAGILCDISLNQPAAALTVVLTVTGILVGFLADTVMSHGFPTYFFCCAAVLLVVSFTQMFTLLFFEAAPPYALLTTGLYQTLYSLIYTLPVYFIVRALSRPAHGA